MRIFSKLKLLLSILAVTTLTSVAFVATPVNAACPDPTDPTCTPTATAQAPAATCTANGFLTFPAWYRGLTDGDCNIVSPGDGPGQVSLQNYIWVIVLNVIEIALQLIAYITVAMVIYGGFLFMTGGGEPTKMVQARRTIVTAVIGLALSTVSIGIVNLILRLING